MLRMDMGVLYELYSGPAKVLTWDPCPFGQPIILTAAHIVSYIKITLVAV